jgi:hypothetical protein
MRCLDGSRKAPDPPSAPALRGPHARVRRRGQLSHMRRALPRGCPLQDPPTPTPTPKHPTTAGWTSIDFIESTLMGYGVPYDVVRVDSAAAPPADLNAVLYNGDGSAKYAGIYM